MALGNHPQWGELELSEFLNGSALLVIDPTNGVLHRDGAQSADGLWQRARREGGSLNGILRLVAFARSRNIPVAWLRYEYMRQHFPATPLDAAQYAYWYQNRRWTPEQKAWERSAVEEIATIKQDGDLDSVYTSFGNVFIGSPLLPTLNTWGARTLLICGYHLDHCVEQAARSARDFGLMPFVVGDCCGASEESDEAPTLARIDANWAPAISVKDVITG